VKTLALARRRAETSAKLPGTGMAVFDIFKRLVNQNSAPDERRTDGRVRATLGARVLVVDDSATIRAVLGKMLLQDGYFVLRAVDGESAVETAQAELPDLIFLDIVLPGMSGFAVLRALRRDSRTRITPIIMMSGNQQATEQFYVQRFGADGFIKKPFGRAEVFHAVRSLVQGGRMRARVETVATDAIPEGISREEWNAIPDVALPDEAHAAVQTAVTDGIGVLPASAAARPIASGPSNDPAAPAPRSGSMGGPAQAASPAMRPTLATGMHASTPPAITVVVAPHAPAAKVVEPTPAAPGGGRDNGN
jgi:twitching motility two-component system response regulator PilH